MTLGHKTTWLLELAHLNSNSCVEPSLASNFESWQADAYVWHTDIISVVPNRISAKKNGLLLLM
jgi:hypothetical protein